MEDSHSPVEQSKNEKIRRSPAHSNAACCGFQCRSISSQAAVKHPDSGIDAFGNRSSLPVPGDVKTEKLPSDAIMMPASDIFNAAIVAAAGSFFVSMLIVLTQGWHGKHSLDLDLAGIQKFHVKPVPRIGGIALVVGMLAALLYDLADDSYFVRKSDADDFLKLLLASAPSFLAGLTEDLTKRVSAKIRLFATLASAVMASWLVGAYLSRLDIWGLDSLLRLMPVAIVVTAIAVAGVANSINIIDGFHGVAGCAVSIILGGMGFLAWQAGDVFVARLALLGIGAALGFLLVNYPTGRLFMGDSGAYFLGFWLAEVAVLLVIRNPSINAWQVLAICGYPVIEVLFSIYRRRVIRKSSPGAPDRLHLHTLIYRRVVCQLLPRNHRQPWIRNAPVACIVSMSIAAITVIAVLAGDTVPAAVAVVIAELLLYSAVYARLVRGRWHAKPAAPQVPPLRSGRLHE